MGKTRTFTIRFKLLILVIFLLVLSPAVISTFNLLKLKKAYEDVVLKNCNTLAYDVSTTILQYLKYFSLDEFVGMNDFLQRKIQKQENIICCYITSRDGLIIYHSDPHNTGLHYEKYNLVTLFDHSQFSKIVEYDENLELILPINLEQELIGAVHLLINKKDIVRPLVMSIWQNILITFIVIAATIYLLVLFCSRFIAAPVNKLAGKMDYISTHHDFEHIAPDTAGSELSALVTAFNRMTVKLRVFYEELEDRVNIRTNELCLANNKLVTELGERKKIEANLIKSNEELRNAEIKLQEIDKEKSQLLSVVSHELRNPLTAILGFTQLTRDEIRNTICPAIPHHENQNASNALQKISDYLAIIMGEINRMVSMINDLLDLAKMESCKIKWKFQPVNVAEVIQRATSTLSPLIESSKLKLVNEIDANLPQITGDPNRLIQVMINLVSNAINFTEEGTITCKAQQFEDNIIVSVIDTGIGIRTVDQEKIWGLFQQVHSDQKGKQKGTGLGLAICQQIIKSHKGKIWVESEPDKGSTFRFSLPIPLTLR